MAAQTDTIEKIIERVLEQLRLKIATAYRLPPPQPLDEQLFAIISELVGLKETSGQVSEDDFFYAVEKNCPGGTRLVYSGSDLSDLNGLLTVFQREIAGRSGV